MSGRLVSIWRIVPSGGSPLDEPAYDKGSGAACQVLAHVQTVQLILKYEPVAAPQRPVDLLGERLAAHAETEQGGDR